STTAATGTSGEQGLAPVGTGEQALGPPRQQATTTTTAPTTTAAPTTSTAAPDGTATTAAATTVTTLSTTDTTLSTTDTTLSTTDTIPTTPATTPPAPPNTPREQDTKDAEVVLPEYDENGVETFRWLLGPTIVTGDALVAADTQATINPSTGEWLVQIRFKDGDENVGAWRRAAAACFQGADPLVCPTGRLAAVLDGVVISAPQVNDTFQGSNEAVITGQFGQDEAQQLAQQLRYGALPVQFERQQSQDVSATIGRDALTAGIAAGLIGLAVVAIYILLYYRLLGLVALASLALSFGLLWSIISWLGSSYGLALSLSGVVGIIVSIGVSIDSNIVYFEHVKDDMATGRTLRSSAQRAFTGAMSTIVKADLVSLIGAALLYFLTVGPVKGFALYLGLSTLLDLVASYFFMRPAVVLLAGTDLATRNPRAFGIPTPNPVAAKAVS
ncbi:MAG: preprotein translocase subunit SecD, partial [Acidimicrobiia bacterium]